MKPQKVLLSPGGVKRWGPLARDFGRLLGAALGAGKSRHQVVFPESASKSCPRPSHTDPRKPSPRRGYGYPNPGAQLVVVQVMGDRDDLGCSYLWQD